MSSETSAMTVTFLHHLRSWRRCDLPRRCGLERSYLEEDQRSTCLLVSAGSSMETPLILNALMQNPAWTMSRSGDSSVVVFSDARCCIRFTRTSCLFRY